MKKLTGPKLLAAAVNQILTHPETWDQGRWHCGTKHCIGGWCQILAGFPQNSFLAEKQAKEVVGLSYADATWLFSPNRTLSELHHFAKVLLAGYNRGGHDRGGYDRGGYDRDGYDRDGYDRDGYARDGYNRGGHDRGGYDRGGYDRGGQKLELLPI